MATKKAAKKASKAKVTSRSSEGGARAKKAPAKKAAGAAKKKTAASASKATVKSKKAPAKKAKKAPLTAKAQTKKAPSAAKAQTKKAPAKKKAPAAVASKSSKTPAKKVAAKAQAKKAPAKKASGKPATSPALEAKKTAKKVAARVKKIVDQAPSLESLEKALQAESPAVKKAKKAITETVQDIETKAKNAAREVTKKIREWTQADAPAAEAAPGRKPKPAPQKKDGAPAKKVAATQEKEEVKVKSASITAGDTAPGFSLSDQSGKIVSSDDLAGKPYVLYFYPKDDTPGCTVEACDFRDGFGELESAGVAIFGVSPDSAKSHAKFAEKFSLPFPLLVDDEHELSTAYGAWALKKNYGKEYWGVVRSTFLVDRDGKVRKVWPNVKVAGHAQAVLAEARQL